jgi:AraC family transcriptional regulator
MALSGAAGPRRHESDWRTPSPPSFQGGHVVASHEQTWSGLCAVVVDVRADGEIRAPLRASFARICMSLEEVGGPFEITATPATVPAGAGAGRAARGAVSVIPPGLSAVGQARTLRFMRHLLLQVDGPALSAWLEDGFDIDAAFAPRLMVSDPRLLQLGQLIAKECVSGNKGDRLYRDGLAVAVFGALGNPLAAGGDHRAASGGLAPWQLRRVLDFMRANLADSIDMAALAGITGLSKAHFSRAFKVSTGLPPHRWLLDARIAKARELLIDSELPLAEIALAVGFADQPHFTRTFGCIVGTPPSAWQRARRRA